MPEFDLLFSATATDDAGSFKLLELPPELDNAIQTNSEPLTLTIKGQPGEDAVLCTDEKTYALRSVALSNSVLVVSSPLPPTVNVTDVEERGVHRKEAVVIRDELHEVLELVPTVPKLHKLVGLLRGRAYDETDEVDYTSKKKGSYYFTYEDAKNEIQASDAELDHGLREKRILIIQGALRPISREYLHTLLELILNLLVSLSLPHEDAPLHDLVSALADDHEVSRTVSLQVMSWFGEVLEKEDKWKMNVEAVLKEVGIGLLRYHRHEPVEKHAFIQKWKLAVGDAFESSINLNLLSGNYLLSTPQDKDLITFFPSSELPINPATRFADLFMTRSRWKGDDIAPFLGDIAVNSKERDKLLLKYCRSVTDAQGVWYTSRAQYNG